MKRFAVGAALTTVFLPLLLLCAASVRFRHAPYHPPAEAESTAAKGRLRLTYRGISGYELTDGKTVVLLDPTVTRPTVWDLFSRRLRPDEARSEERRVGKECRL